jgi:hypothetical protein
MVFESIILTKQQQQKGVTPSQSKKEKGAPRKARR